MTAGAAAERSAEPFEGGDRNYTLTRLPGWLEMVEAPARVQPPRLSCRELAALPRGELLRYNDARKTSQGLKCQAAA